MTMKWAQIVIAATLALTLSGRRSLAQLSGAEAENESFQVGLRLGISAADGEPANDIPWAGLFGRYRLNELWLVGLSLDISEYDYEQPAKIIGLDPAEVVDAQADSTIITAWLEREFRSENGRWRPFILGGLGFGIVDVPDASGDLKGGGRFDIETDAGTEIIPMVGAGIRMRLTQRIHAEVGARGEFHLADWEIKDRVSGTSGSIDDYFAYGGYFGLGCNF